MNVINRKGKSLLPVQLIVLAMKVRGRLVLCTVLLF